MTPQEIKAITIETGKSVNTIEKELKIPQGTLGKAMNGVRALPTKWDGKLKLYAKKNKVADVKEVVEPIIDEEKEILPAALPDWACEIEAFCNLNNCNYQDLMLFYNPVEGLKAGKRPDSSLADMLSVVPKNESYFEKRQREAMGK